MHEASIVLLAAVGLDLLLGDPVYRLHPVRLIGTFISRLERGLRRLHLSGLTGGVFLLVGVLLVVIGIQLGVRYAVGSIAPSLSVAWDVFVLYSCVALRDMLRHAYPIEAALRQGDVEGARHGLSRIVGREVALLDAAAMSRAAVESVAESFVDGFLAPLFWFVVGCAGASAFGGAALPFAVSAAVAYRCVNTLDSMVGYRNPCYLLFGRASARADDLLNSLPARLSLVVLWLGARLLRMNATAGWRVALRDRLKHASPNSAHAESFVAGALGIRLGGPTRYRHGLVDKPWLGDGGNAAEPGDIRLCGNLVLSTGLVSAAIFMLLIEAFI
jgi:adenosylcobinamide-phosphate synthase